MAASLPTDGAAIGRMSQPRARLRCGTPAPTARPGRHRGQRGRRSRRELPAEGHAICVVTHDRQVAENAQRIIEISDGSIIDDRRRSDAPHVAAARAPQMRHAGAVSAGWGRLVEAFHMATLAMAAHRLRTFLTMLGIIIGIASVVSVVALGEGSSRQILERISSMGTNTIDIMSGRGFGDERSGRVQTLVPSDAVALAQESYVDSVTPTVSTSASLRYRNVLANGSINGVGAQFFRVRGYELESGVAFD